MSKDNSNEHNKEKVAHLKWYGIPEVIPFFKPHYKRIFTIIIMFGLCGIIDSILPLFQNYAINHYIGEGTVDTLPMFILAFIGMFAIQAVISFIGLWAAFTTEVYVDRDVRQACFDHVQTLSLSYFNQNSVGYIHSRIISDPNRIGEMASWGLLDAACDFFYVISIFIIMFRLNKLLCLCLLVIVPIEVAVTWFFQRKLVVENRKVREQNGIITGNINEGITGALTIKSLVAAKHIQENFEADTKTMRRVSVRSVRFRTMFRQSIVLLSSVALALVLWRGGYLNREGLILLGTLSVFMDYATNMSMYIQDFVMCLAELVNSQVNIERITNLLKTESNVKDTPEVIEKYGDSLHPKMENWEPLYGDVEFEDVTFMYPDGDENVLEHFSLKIEKGTMTAIVGETGAGKSTIANLVCRFYEPTKGRVLIDGRDARERSQLWLHSHVGCVLQTPHLFGGTVKDNLLYGNSNATREMMEEACRRVKADQVIAKMDKGYDSEITEGGNNLSTGEKQLLSFARALLANPQILILDEATSSVDTLTEKYIQDAISEVTADRTSFVIAHRLSTIRSADLILTMKDGKVIEKGTHEELMQKKGYYYRLYSRQFLMQESENT